ncbi:MAG: hypothetical protein PUD02_08800 [Eggerthellales bacterium]|nr:hypothetical protein [Eggerthellales bacterium]
MSKQRRQNGFWNSLHIKRGTSGTSNELSFSVLDKRKEQDVPPESSINVEKIGGVYLQTNGRSIGLRKAKERGKKEAGVKKPHLSLPAGITPTGQNTGTTPVLGSSEGSGVESSRESRKQKKRRERALADPEAEISRRKRNRTVRRVLFGAVVSLVLAGVGFYSVQYVMNQYQTQLDGMSLLQRGLDELTTADDLVLPMDGVVTGSVDETTVETITQVEEGISGAQVHISAAETFAQDAAETLTTDEERAVADKLSESAQARRDMMEQAQIIMESEKMAISAIASMQECWTLLIQADQLIKDAAALVQNTTVENVQASQEKTQEALDLLYQAQILLAQAQEAYPNANLSMYGPYIEVRIESCQYAIASDEAIYLQDKATAEYNNDMFNQCEAQAAELASSLPAEPAAPILTAFDEDTQQARDSYLDARIRASQSDAYIRDYLGQSEQ